MGEIISSGAGGPGPPDDTHNVSISAWERPNADGYHRKHDLYFGHSVAAAEEAALLLLRGGRFVRVEIFRRTDAEHGWERIADLGPQDAEE